MKQTWRVMDTHDRILYQNLPAYQVERLKQIEQGLQPDDQNSDKRWLVDLVKSLVRERNRITGLLDRFVDDYGLYDDE